MIQAVCSKNNFKEWTTNNSELKTLKNYRHIFYASLQNATTRDISLLGKDICSTKENISMTHKETNIQYRLDDLRIIAVMKNLLINVCHVNVQVFFNIHTLIELFINNNPIDILCVSEPSVTGKHSVCINAAHFGDSKIAAIYTGSNRRHIGALILVNEGFPNNEIKCITNIKNLNTRQLNCNIHVFINVASARSDFLTHSGDFYLD